MPPNVVEKYELEVPTYDGVDQVVELISEGGGVLPHVEEEREGRIEKILKLAERQDL